MSTEPIDGDPALRAAIREEISPFFAELRCFLDRRVSELSAEVHGATQLLGYSEDNLSGQLGKLHEQVARMLAAPADANRSSGIELEAVVHTTEQAANQILEAAESISDSIRTAVPDRDIMADINRKIDAIFEACSFQDISGQRIRRAIEHLQHVDTALADMIAPPGTAAPVYQPRPPTVVSNGVDHNQDEIDAMFD
jgi:chemotaxis protein CheZ